MADFTKLISPDVKRQAEPEIDKKAAENAKLKAQAEENKRKAQQFRGQKMEEGEALLQQICAQLGKGSNIQNMIPLFAEVLNVLGEIIDTDKAKNASYKATERLNEMKGILIPDDPEKRLLRLQVAKEGMEASLEIATDPQEIVKTKNALNWANRQIEQELAQIPSLWPYYHEGLDQLPERPLHFTLEFKKGARGVKSNLNLVRGI